MRRLAFAFLALALAACNKAPEAPKGPLAAADASKKAPGFESSLVIGNANISLESLKGKVVLLDFWATWCGPCRMEIPHFVKLQQDYQQQGFSMLGVSLDRSQSVVWGFLMEHGVNYPVIMDGDGSISNHYGGIRAIPTTVLIDKNGLIRETYVGYRDAAVFEAAVKQLLAET